MSWGWGVADVIEAASAGVKDMADGSLRITFEFEPRFAAEAFALFGPRGRAVAVAALKDGTGAIGGNSTKSEASAPVVPDAGRPKGGEWAKLAGMWCADPDFQMWAGTTYIGRHAGLDEATKIVREKCGIESRAELDHDPEALARFNEHIRYPFMKWMQARGIRK